MAGKKKTSGGKSDKVVVSKSGLEKLMQTVEQSVKDNQALRERLERVESAGDLGRLDAFDNKKRVIGARRYKLSIYEGKVITGWRTLKDKAWKDPASNRMRHEQSYEILFEDSTKMEVAGYENFASIQYGEQVVAEEVDKKTEGAKVTLTVKVVEPDHEKNGQEYVVDLAFVN